LKEEEYIELLKRGRSMLPEKIFKTSRFELPKIISQMEGNRTVITNWNQIIRAINRESDHVAKYLAKEFATAANFEGGRLIMQGKFRLNPLDRQISLYTKNYVICPECKKPDTKLVREGRVLLKVCEACGARVAIK
jgi:translation initiation factor 2 subunit 2